MVASFASMVSSLALMAAFYALTVAFFTESSVRMVAFSTLMAASWSVEAKLAKSSGAYGRVLFEKTFHLFSPVTTAANPFFSVFSDTARSFPPHNL